MKPKTYKSPPMHKTPDGKFEYGWIRSPRDVIGKIEPFAQGWHVQYLGDGTSDFCANRRGVFDFVADFYDIGSTAYPLWLRKELSSERLEEHDLELLDKQGGGK